MQQYEKTKQALRQATMEYINHRISNALQAIAAAREATHDDTKSSAGDKYETTREMMQQDITRNEKLLMEARSMETAMTQIRIDLSSKIVGPGSVIETGAGKFFMAVSAGKLNVEGNTYLVISPASPIGKLFMGKKDGDKVSFNNRTYFIKSVW
ncbi:GreA/GreB family elongation factor [Olivibacter sitiensis]|uniref:GreA/GreB family elongation factor n=1 Tax=Olivibacter sitiensis TaxID=376470 RepID=UPI00041E9238|nr:GreA/GreB family elongation factor [Olivibacter sitiensis]